MIKLSYCTFGLTNLDFLDSIGAVDKAGYPGVELSFHRDQFNPFEITDEYLAAIKKRFGTLEVKPACVATASHFFTPSRPHEPSLMSSGFSGQKTPHRPGQAGDRCRPQIGRFPRHVW